MTWGEALIVAAISIPLSVGLSVLLASVTRRRR